MPAVPTDLTQLHRRQASVARLATMGASSAERGSGTMALGVVRRRPDAKWRRRAQDLQANGALQAELLRAALAVCRSGGVVTYAVCSQEPEETLAPVREVLQDSLATMIEEPPPLAQAKAALGYFLPGMYIAQLRRR